MLQLDQKISQNKPIRLLNQKPKSKIKRKRKSNKRNLNQLLKKMIYSEIHQQQQQHKLKNQNHNQLSQKNKNLLLNQW
jgi:hypothetical protein